MLEELIVMFSLLDDKGVIQIHKPKSGRSGAELMALDTNFHEQVGN